MCKTIKGCKNNKIKDLLRLKSMLTFISNTTISTSTTTTTAATDNNYYFMCLAECSFS